MFLEAEERKEAIMRDVVKHGVQIFFYLLIFVLVLALPTQFLLLHWS